jgi:hypothetical protein
MKLYPIVYAASIGFVFRIVVADVQVPKEFYESGEIGPEHPVTYFVGHIGGNGFEQLFVTADHLSLDSDRAVWEVYERPVGTQEWKFLDGIVLNPNDLYQGSSPEGASVIISSGEDEITFYGVRIIDGKVKATGRLPRPQAKSAIVFLTTAVAKPESTPVVLRTPVSAPGQSPTPSPTDEGGPSWWERALTWLSENIPGWLKSPWTWIVGFSLIVLMIILQRKS